MATPLSIIEHSPFSTSLLHPLDESPLYTVSSRWHAEGFWVDAVHCTDGTHSDSEKEVVRRELATVFYIDAGTTRVRFRGNVEVEVSGEQSLEGEVEVGLDAFLRRRKPYSNSRIFVGPDGVTYKWRIDGKKLELYDTATHTVIARSHPRRSKISIIPLSLPGMTKRKDGDSSPHTERTARLHHPTLSLHPALLSLESDSQLRDAIVLTYVIMQRLLKDRLRYRRFP